jgi:outer membrane immunogenic protein
MRTSVAALAVLMTTTSLAGAADLSRRYQPPPAPILAMDESNWTGFYVGIQGSGWNRFAVEQKSTLSFGGVPIATATTSASANRQALIFGAFAGYNYEFANKVVVGLEAQINHSMLSDWNNFGVRSGSIQGTGLVRVGYDFGRILPYIAGGVSVQNYDVHLTPVWSVTSVAPTAGAGLDFKVTDHLMVGVQYNHVFGDKATTTRTTGAGLISFTDQFGIRNTEDRVMGRVSYKF